MTGDTAAPVQRTVTVRNERGLHARAAARFVRLAEQFDAEVTVRKGDQVVPGRSIMGLMMLAAATGSALELIATGKEAGSAITALAALVDNGFDEE